MHISMSELVIRGTVAIFEKSLVILQVGRDSYAYFYPF